MQNEVERRIDELGRIVIPKDFLNYLHVKKNSLFRITLTYDSLILEPIQEKNCIFCHDGEELIKTPKGYICEACFQEIASSIK